MSILRDGYRILLGQNEEKLLKLIDAFNVYSGTGSWTVNMGHSLKCCASDTPSVINFSRLKETSDWRGDMEHWCYFHKGWHMDIWSDTFRCYQRRYQLFVRSCVTYCTCRTARIPSVHLQPDATINPSAIVSYCVRRWSGPWRHWVIDIQQKDWMVEIMNENRHHVKNDFEKVYNKW